VSETAQAPSDVEPAPPVATGEPEANPEAILQNEEFVDWQDMKKHLSDPDLEKAFDKSPDEDEPDKEKEQETGYQTPSTASTATEATATHDEL
jgi:hypothetical protein